MIAALSCPPTQHEPDALLSCFRLSGPRRSRVMASPTVRRTDWFVAQPEQQRHGPKHLIRPYPTGSKASFPIGTIESGTSPPTLMRRGNSLDPLAIPSHMEPHPQFRPNHTSELARRPLLDSIPVRRNAPRPPSTPHAARAHSSPVFPKA